MRRRKAALCFAILLLIVASYTIVKAVRDAVFLSRFGVTEISMVAIGLAVVAGVVAGVYERATRGLSRARVIGASHGVIAASLLLIWLGLDHPATAWILYVWSSLFGVFIVMQFWLLTGDLFSLREAKGAFSVIASGGIVGGLVGGVSANVLADVISAGSLLLLAGAMLLVAALLSGIVWRLRTVEPAPTTRRGQAEAPPTLVALLSKPSFVRSVAVTMLAATVATTLLDWQLKAIAKQHFADRTDDMAAFFGSLFAFQSAAALAVQLVVAAWLLRRFGLGVGRLSLPFVVLLGAVAIASQPMLGMSLLAIAATVKVSEGAVRHAIDKSVNELTWLPVPKAVRDRSKSFVDTVVDRLGTGLTGLLWLGLAAAGLDAPNRVHLIAVVVVAVVSAWLLAARVTQKRHLDTFRHSLAHRSIDLQGLRLSLGEAEARRRLAAALESDDPDQARFGLYLLEDAERGLPDLSGPLGHRDAGVRLQALRLLNRQSHASQADAVAACLDDQDPRVRELAIVYLGRHAPASAQAASSMEGDLIALGDENRRAAAKLRIRERLAAGHDKRVEQIGLVGAAPPEAAAELLAPLLDDEDAAVVRAALQAAGRARAIALAPRVAAFLEVAQHRPRAAGALADMNALDHVAELLSTERSSLGGKLAMIRLLGASRDAACAPPLVSQLDGIHQPLRAAAIVALARLNAAVRVQVPGSTVDGLLKREVEALYRRLLILRKGSWPLARSAATADFFERVMQEDASKRVGKLFRLLSLRHDPDDLRTSARAIGSPFAATRAKGVEFLDNLLSPADRPIVLPPLEDLGPKELRGAARKVEIRREEMAAVLDRLLTGDDRWLRCVACWKIGHDRIGSLTERLEALEVSDPWLSPIRQNALARLRDPTLPMTLTVLDKALKLRAVDVLKEASSEDLAYVAEIAEQRDVEAETQLYAEGDAPDALYVVLSGEVDLMQAGDNVGTAVAGEAFGSWALVDESPRVATAKTKTATSLLTVDREDFQDLLADRPDIVQAVLKAMVAQIRALAELAKV